MSYVILGLHSALLGLIWGLWGVAVRLLTPRLGLTWVAPLAMDETQRTIMVAWTRAGQPDFRYYEMITVAEDGLAKNRTWHWYEKGRLFQRTLINEDYVTADWQALDDPAYYAFQPRAPR